MASVLPDSTAQRPETKRGQRRFAETEVPANYSNGKPKGPIAFKTATGQRPPAKPEA